MAMAASGKSTEKRRTHCANKEIASWIANIRHEEETANNWKKRWGWMAKEYVNLQEQLAEVTKTSKFLRNVNKNPKIPDLRCIHPVPETTSGIYGWIPNKPEFKLEKWGPDLFQPMPLPEMYDLQTGHFHVKA